MQEQYRLQWDPKFYRLGVGRTEDEGGAEWAEVKFWPARGASSILMMRVFSELIFNCN